MHNFTHEFTKLMSVLNSCNLTSCCSSWNTWHRHGRIFTCFVTWWSLPADRHFLCPDILLLIALLLSSGHAYHAVYSCFNRKLQSNGYQLLHNREVSVSHLGLNTRRPGWCFSWSLAVPQEKCRTVPKIRPFPSTSFRVHSSSIILYRMLLRAPLNKPEIRKYSC
jgi:hypothetical protein